MQGIDWNRISLLSFEVKEIEDGTACADFSEETKDMIVEQARKKILEELRGVECQKKSQS